MKRLSIVLLGLTAMAVLAQESRDAKKNHPSTPASSVTLDRMIAAGKSQRELAKYVFDTHGCGKCHTVGSKGKLGFTDEGKQRAQGFEGCISILTAMT
jgi:cytochrome c5